MGIEGLTIAHQQDCGAEEAEIILDRGSDIEVECVDGHTHHIKWTDLLPYIGE